MGRAQVDEMIDRMADAVKDALVDWDWCPPDEAGEGGTAPLPPLSAEQFVDAMRPRVEEALRRVAACLNEGPGPDLSAAAEERVLDHFGRLCSEALEVGRNLREDAAETPPMVAAPCGTWALRYRRMMVLEGRWPFQVADWE
jgi:hypothetical protein